jgi:predicted ATP-grasp superfamily ATP-dependent carboligase
MSPQFIVQKFVEGKAASACVFSTGKKALAVSLNRQFVALGSPEEESGYLGGEVPFKHTLEKTAQGAAERAVEAVKGLKGYVGVDMTLTDEEPVIMEVNPRLTVSYVGLQKVADNNPAETIIDTVTKQRLPDKVQLNGYSFFAKVKVPPRPKIIAETCMLNDVVSPPFPTETNKPAYALVAVASTTPEGAESAFYRTKKRLQELYRGGD